MIYDSDRQTAKIFTLSSQNVSKYKLLTGNVLPEKYLLEKVAALERSEYSPLGCELKKQTCIVEKQYQGLNKHFEPDKKNSKN